MKTLAAPRPYAHHNPGLNWLDQIRLLGPRGVRMPKPRMVNGVCPIRDMVNARFGEEGEVRFVEDGEHLTVYFVPHEDDTNPDPHDDPQTAIMKDAKRLLSDFNRRAIRLPSQAVLVPAA